MFQGMEGFMKLGHFDKNFLKNSRKKALLGKSLDFLFPDTLITIF